MSNRSSSTPRVSIFGIGYVGAVTAACIADDGFHVVAVDVNGDKVAMLASGKSPIIEPGLADLLGASVRRDLLTATTDARAAIADSDLSLICVGTPSLPNGNLNLSHVVSVAEEIGKNLRDKDRFHSVVVRSTMLPGAMEGTVIPILERASGKRAGSGFGVAYYPEFLREATAIKDYREPTIAVLGTKDDTTLERLRALNAKLNVREILVDIPTAEAIKYVNNSWHAVKVSFANEIGAIAQAAGIDGQAIMAALCADQRLNISTAYLRPGMAYGGSCLPKDLRALCYKARLLDVNTPLLGAVEASNHEHINRAFNLIACNGQCKVGMLGLSFKADTDDLRESPLVEIAERLHGKGFEIRIFDRNVRYSALTGANLSYVRARLPHLAALMVDTMDEIVDYADVIVVGNADPTFKDVVERKRSHQRIVDYVRLDSTARSDLSSGYVGLAW